MKSADLREKLHRYIDTADEKKLKAIFTMVQEEIEETQDHWSDATFMNELKEQEVEYLKGTMKTYSVDESIAQSKDAIKKVKQK